MTKMTLAWGGAAHNVFAFRFEERLESDVVVPIFAVEIENPGVGGLLSASARQATVSGDGFTATGRLISAPVEMGSRTIEVEFRCVPEDEDAVIRAAADGLRSGEGVDDDAYDPLFVNAEDDDPATALAGRSEVWRWDRVTNEIGRIGLADGPLVDLGRNGIEGSLQVRVGNPPRKKTKMRLTAGWTQVARGRETINQIAQFSTYTWQDFIAAFPSPGDPIGDNAGWTFDQAEITSVSFLGAADAFTVSGDKFGAASGGQVFCKAAQIECTWRGAYDYQQAREEIIDITLVADVQDVLGSEKTETAEVIQLGPLHLDNSTPTWRFEDPETLEPQTYEVGDVVQRDGRTYECVLAHTASPNFVVAEDGVTIWESILTKRPLSNLSSSRFFDTERGGRAIRHALRRLKRHVLRQSMCVEISFEAKWDLVAGITTANRVRIVHDKLPGGAAVGKVTGVELMTQGSSRFGRITMLCSVGNAAGEVDPGVPEEAFTVTAPTPASPINVGLLPSGGASSGGLRYLVVDDAPTQRWGASMSSDPVETIGSLPTKLYLWGYLPLNEEALLTRRLSVVTDPVAIPGGITL